MKTTTLLVALLSFALGAGSLLAACGGESESSGGSGTGGGAGVGAKGGSGGSTGGATGGGTGGTSGGGGSTGGAGGAGTGGASGAGTGGASGAGTGGAAGAAPSDPGSVPCGTSGCAVPDNYCCDATMNPGDEKCVPATVSSCAGFRRMCNEAADCNAGMVCCTIPAAAPFYAYSTACGQSCDSFFPQICKTSSECKNGQSCVTQQCNGWIVQSCGPIPTQLACK